jgi:RNA polymerase sigma-70 factor (ECF subfamily)
MTDEELMVRYLAGDDSAFELLYGKYSGKVYAYLRKKLNSPQEVEELFQISFLKFHRARDRYNSKYPVLQWMFVIVRSSLIDHYRKTARQVDLSDIPIECFSEPMSQNEAAPSLISERAGALLGQLPRHQRDIVTRRIIDDQTYEEIALSLNCSEESIRQTVSRTLRKMKTNLIPKERRS